MPDPTAVAWALLVNRAASREKGGKNDRDKDTDQERRFGRAQKVQGDTVNPAGRVARRIGVTFEVGKRTGHHWFTDDSITF